MDQGKGTLKDRIRKRENVEEGRGSIFRTWAMETWTDVEDEGLRSSCYFAWSFEDAQKPVHAVECFTSKITVQSAHDA